MTRAASLALASVTLALAGCQQPAKAPAWFPRVTGAYWVYELRTPEGRSEVRVDALGEREIEDLGVRVFLAEETRTAPGRFDPVNPIGYVVEGDFLAQIEGLVYDGDGRLRVLGDGRATRILPLAPHPGLRWVQETRAFAAGGSDARLRWEAEIGAADAIEVPAGRFDQIVEVRTTLRDERGVVLGRYRDVFARGVGRVYGLVLVDSEEPPRSEELRLLRYRLPVDDTVLGR